MSKRADKEWGEMWSREKEMECDDAISRQAVLDQTYLWSKDEFLRVTNPFDYLRKRINSLSPVTPQQKYGSWIRIDKDKCQCDQCEVISLIAMYPNGDANYCPNCGRRMVESQERSE